MIIYAIIFDAMLLVTLAIYATAAAAAICLLLLSPLRHSAFSVTPLFDLLMPHILFYAIFHAFISCRSFRRDYAILR